MKLANKMQEMRRLLAEAGVEDLDELAVARLAKAKACDDSPKARLRSVLSALGMREVPEDALDELLAAQAKTASEDEFVDAIFIGPCPFCDSSATRSAENEPGIEDPTVGICSTCKRHFCSECGELLTRGQLACQNPACWLNQDDEEEEGEDLQD